MNWQTKADIEKTCLLFWYIVIKEDPIALTQIEETENVNHLCMHTGK